MGILEFSFFFLNYLWHFGSIKMQGWVLMGIHKHQKKVHFLMILKVLFFCNFTGKKKKVMILRKTKKGINGKIGKTWMQCDSLTDWTNILVNGFFAFLKSSFGCMTKKQHVEIESLSLGIKLQFCPSLRSSVAGLIH